MILPLALPISLLLLAAAPGAPVAPGGPLPYDPQAIAPAPGTLPPQDQTPQGQARALALNLGHTIGVAMECAVGQDMDNAESKAEQMVDQAANNAHEDPMELEDRFHDAMAEGRDQVLDNQADCSRAKSDLDKFQGQQPY
jgi:ElaB/YqjD/DUF883 family membrane-anchored ribosome-binding protein